MFGAIWTEDAMDELADIWVTVEAAIRDRFEAAVNRLNSELRANGPEFGESRAGTVRIGFATPLVILFTFDDSTRTSVIFHVWRYGK